jgi:type IV pilus assembly protein PilB
VGRSAPIALAKFLSETFGHPLLDLEAVDPAALPADLIDPKLATEVGVIALGRRGNRLSVAVSDPTDLQSLDRVKFQAQATIDPIVVTHDRLMKAVEQRSKSASDQLAEMVDDVLDIEVTDGEEANRVDTNAEIDDAPVVKFLQKILLGRDQQWRLGHPFRTLREVLPDPLPDRR